MKAENDIHLPFSPWSWWTVFTWRN